MASAFDFGDKNLSQSGYNGSQDYKGPNGQVLRKAQGGWYIGPGGEQIWDPVAYFKQQGDQNQPLSQFVSNNSVLSTTTPYAGQVGDLYKHIQSYLNAPQPTLNQVNRFEPGLAANEQRLNALLTDPNSVQQTAAYKFRVGQGQDALQRQLAAKGMLGSGNRLMELTKYGQDMASQEYDTQAKRLSDLVGMYSGNWTGDKNANTAQFSAQTNAANQRGGLLASLYTGAGGLANEANRNMVGERQSLANIWRRIPSTRNYVTGGLDMSRFRTSGVD